MSCPNEGGCLRERELNKVIDDVGKLSGKLSSAENIAKSAEREALAVRRMLDDNGQPGIQTTVIRTSEKVGGLKDKMASVDGKIDNLRKLIIFGILLPVATAAITIIIDRLDPIVSAKAEEYEQFYIKPDSVYNERYYQYEENLPRR